MTESRQPLTGIRVVDFTHVLAGPFGTTILADMGAEVFKIENPVRGEIIRKNAPFVNGESHYYLSLNRNKRSLGLNLKQAKAKQIVFDLVRTADVVIDNYRPGVMERLGFGYEALSAINPRIVMCSISGFGQEGPLRDKTSFDIVTQAMSGMMSITGHPNGPPARLGLPMGDLAGGFYAALGVMAALIERGVTGRGRYVDISLLDCSVGMLGYLAGLYFTTGESPGRVGSGHHNIVPYNAFEASDGWVIISAFTQEFWAKLCPALGHPEWDNDPRFAGMEDRLKYRGELEELITNITKQRTVAHWTAHLEEWDVPTAPVLSVGQAVDHPNTLARGMVVEIDHPKSGRIKVLNTPIRFPHTARPQVNPPPTLGEHTDYILREVLKYTPESIADLHRTGVLS